MAYWNVIEIIGIAYHIETDRTSLGVRNKIYQCFIERFGPAESWELPHEWIDKMYELRNQIVHGDADTTIEAINRIALHIPLLEKWSKKTVDKLLAELYQETEFDYYEW